MSEIECKYKFLNAEKFNGQPYCTCFLELCEKLEDDGLCQDNCQIYDDYKQLQQLKAENEKLRKLKTIEGLTKGFELNRKLQQKLEKIKNVVSTCLEFRLCNHCSFFSECDGYMENYILQIIEGKENNADIQP